MWTTRLGRNSYEEPGASNGAPVNDCSSSVTSAAMMWMGCAEKMGLIFSGRRPAYLRTRAGLFRRSTSRPRRRRDSSLRKSHVAAAAGPRLVLRGHYPRRRLDSKRPFPMTLAALDHS